MAITVERDYVPNIIDHFSSFLGKFCRRPFYTVLFLHTSKCLSGLLLTENDFVTVLDEKTIIATSVMKMVRLLREKANWYLPGAIAI